jgi:type IV pilus assembly protein PilQ
MPAAATAPAPTPVAPEAPLPESAFRSDAEARAPVTPAPPSRFETRRIGVDEAPRARFHGAPVDLDLKDADLANVFRLLADVGHVNIVVAGEVTGTITLRLKHVPWDQALEVVARARDLDLERDGNVIVVRSARKP